jgi:putative membrane protein insertion efficiency factor
MSELPEEASGRQPRLPAFRPAVGKRRRRICLIAVLVVAIAALCDWTRPPSQQLSVLLYRTVVLKGYHVVLQPLGRRVVRCRFEPTCSVYSRYAMETHGFPKGVWLTTSRLFRCMPWVPLGTRDPVPPREEEPHPKGTTEH